MTNPQLSAAPALSRAHRPLGANLTFDGVLRAALALAFGFACIIVLVVAFVILQGAAPALAQISWARFLTDPDWHPMVEMYNMTPMLVGSVLTSIGALVLATPVSLAIAAACNFYLNPLAASIYRRILFVMAAMPTVIFGFWGLTEVVPFLGQIKAPGVSLLAGVLILALMIIPTTALLIDVAFSKLPRQLLNGAYALGASRAQTCFTMACVVVRRAIFSAALLGLGRALGETIVVVMVTGNKAALPTSIFDPIRTLTANVTLEIGYAAPLHTATLFLSILILFMIATGLALLVYKLNFNDNTQVDV
ncbi:PstC family ABC transporter permease [Tateyamaria sp.]|uniref:PstC family ABC transporter permease n=1 Tax=Tateyamaria sp. TaxID=1929288 RepID=UPI003B214AD8